MSDTVPIFINIKIFNSPKKTPTKMTATDETDKLIMGFFNEEKK